MRTPLNRNVIVCAIASAALLIALSFELYSFARVQNVWIDESTQLSGIKLEPLEILRWLSGVSLDRFGVPGDRMPPVSYLLDWLWLHLFGPSVLGFRLFHSAFVILGAAALAAFAWRELGPAVAVLVLGFFVLSPKLIQTGVEIRCYPILFALTSVQVVIFSKLVSRNKLDPALLVSFGLTCLTAIYTHYYGLVSSCAFFLALGIAFIRTPSSLGALAAAFGTVMIGSLGLFPFVTSAVVQSAPAANEKTVAQYLTYLFRLFGDSANMVSVLASLLFFLGTLALFSAGAVTAVVRARRWILRPSDWLFVVVFAGVLAPILASLVVRTFNVLSASYSGWLFAPLVLLIGIGASSSTGFRPWDRGGRFVAASAMLIGAAFSTHVFLFHAPFFVHGPERFVGAIYDEATSPKAIVYEPEAAWAFSYFPLVFSHDRKIIQLRATDSGNELVRIGDTQRRAAAEELGAALAPYNDVLIVDVKLRTFRDLRMCLNTVASCPFADGETAKQLVNTGHWTETKLERSFGLYDTQIKLFKRVNPSPDERNQ